MEKDVKAVLKKKINKKWQWAADRMEKDVKAVLNKEPIPKQDPRWLFAWEQADKEATRSMYRCAQNVFSVECVFCIMCSLTKQRGDELHVQALKSILYSDFI